MRKQWIAKSCGQLAKTAVAVSLAGTIGTMSAPAAHASLLGGLTGTLGNTVGTVGATVNGLVGVVTAGWDDGVTTAPTQMSAVANAIGADRLRNRGFDGSGVGIAEIDTGVAPVNALSAPGKIVNGPDLSFESQDDDYRHVDTYGHGTHMAGIMVGEDTSGFSGIAPGAHLVSLKVSAHDGAVDVSQVIAAINWVIEHKNDPGMNIRVLNLSYGTDGVQPYQVDPITYAVEAAWRHGIVVVVAGGNEGTTHPSLTNPADHPLVLAVRADDINGTASSLDDAVAPFSSRGSSSRWVDVTAPGVSIVSLRDPGSQVDQDHPSAVVDTNYFRGSGTSQAAAVTSGAVALLLSARPNLTPDQVKALLRTTASPIVSATARSGGAGLLNINAASLTAPPPSSRRRPAAGAPAC